MTAIRWALARIFGRWVWRTRRGIWVVFCRCGATSWDPGWKRKEAVCSPCRYTGAAALCPNYSDNTRVVIDGVDVTDGSVPMLAVRRGDKVTRMTVTGVRYEDEA